MTFNLQTGSESQSVDSFGKSMTPARWTFLVIGIAIVVVGVILMMNSSIPTVDPGVGVEDTGALILDKGRPILILLGFVLAALAVFGRRKK